MDESDEREIEKNSSNEMCEEYETREWERERESGESKSNKLFNP